MNVFGAALAIFGSLLSTSQTFPVRFAQVTVGENVTISIDGGRAETVFAGKMGFQDRTHAWQSVCADVRSPISQGQFFNVRALSALQTGGNIADAGNIVSRCFYKARTPDQCAGLQVAVWKAIEDGPDWADFSTGRLRVQAGLGVMMYAQMYYQAAGQGGDAVFLQAGGGQNQGGGEGAAAGGQAGGGGGQSQLSPGGGNSD